ncbi:snoaL-like polyketide cyclase [Anaerotignum neopropionicum]|uniref:SnoaL-like polyketide cyclase n=1 Tax=Anaerotignum neopropionicum TaxID=36847 RepID=A0A136WB93_9FIRM|nr:ester cyclase [Anaerotignum neopropionicum]KXL51706.1 snoaL-like polyketide cyclase [Anaerotignum neopropionicum]
MENKEKVRYFYEQITSNHCISEVCDYVSNACTIRLGEKSIPVGVDGMKQHMMEVRKTYPDLKMIIINQYCDGDYVISEFIMEGTHKGEWLGMKPSGKLIKISGVNIDKMADGKIIEHGGAANTFDALFEAGIIQPTP